MKGITHCTMTLVCAKIQDINTRDLRRMTHLLSYLSIYVLPSPSGDSRTTSSGSSMSLSSAVVSASTDAIADVGASWISCHTQSNSLEMTL